MSPGQTGHITGQMGRVPGTDGTHTRGCPAKILLCLLVFSFPLKIYTHTPLPEKFLMARNGGRGEGACIFPPWIIDYWCLSNRHSVMRWTLRTKHALSRTVSQCWSACVSHAGLSSFSEQQNHTRTTSSTVLGTPPNHTRNFLLEELRGGCPGIGGVPTTPDPNTSAKVPRYK